MLLYLLATACLLIEGSKGKKALSAPLESVVCVVVNTAVLVLSAQFIAETLNAPLFEANMCVLPTYFTIFLLPAFLAVIEDSPLPEIATNMFLYYLSVGTVFLSFILFNTSVNTIQHKETSEIAFQSISLALLGLTGSLISLHSIPRGTLILSKTTFSRLVFLKESEREEQSLSEHKSQNNESLVSLMAKRMTGRAISKEETIKIKQFQEENAQIASREERINDTYSLKNKTISYTVLLLGGALFFVFVCSLVFCVLLTEISILSCFKTGSFKAIQSKLSFILSSNYAPIAFYCTLLASSYFSFSSSAKDLTLFLLSAVFLVQLTSMLFSLNSVFLPENQVFLQGLVLLSTFTLPLTVIIVFIIYN